MNIQTPEQEPLFGPVLYRDPRHDISDEARASLHQERVAKGMDELAEGANFAEGLEALSNLHEMRERLMRRAKIAYPADVLEGASNARKGENNWAGLVSHLGYEPDTDEPIGVLVPVSDSPYGADLAFVSPLLRDDKWIVPNSGAIDRSPTLSEGRIPPKPNNLYKTIMRSGFPADSFQDKVPVTFDSREQAMESIMSELEANSYTLLNEGPRTIPQEAVLGHIALGPKA